MYGIGHLTSARELLRSFAQHGAEAETEVEALQRRLDQQNLVLQALLAMLLEKGVVDETELREWIKRMDALDGARDGRLGDDLTEVACPSCGRSNRKTAAQCRHCGVALEPDLVPPRP
jgi:methionyl-tRNA synthetase